MKFYIDNNGYYWNKIFNNNLTAIYYNSFAIKFFKNGEKSNSKNASYINNINKQFFLNGKYYGSKNKFTKQSWRRFVKLNTFL